MALKTREKTVLAAVGGEDIHDYRKYSRLCVDEVAFEGVNGEQDMEGKGVGKCRIPGSHACS